jgi:CRISPR-associated endoribonuclease Cas6
MTSNPTFFAFVIHMQVSEAAQLPATQGDLAHAAFLALVRAVQPDLAARLHNRQGRKPFSLSPVWDLPPTQNGIHRLRAGHTARLRLTLLNSDLFQAFTQSLLQGPRLTLRLGQAEFLITEVLGTPGSEPWAGFTTLQDLTQAAGADHTVRLLFASPTSIGLGRTDSGKARRETLPVPRYVWASLRGGWQAFTGHAQHIPLAFEDWVERNVVTSRVNRWQTSVFRFRKGLQVGGHGDVTFEALDDTPEMLHCWNLLADFAFYSGIGYKTSMGMGTVRRVVG